MRRLSAFSDHVARLERLMLMALVALILALILLNVVTRAASASLYWVDEAAILAMVFACFVGASMMVRQRMDFAVTLLTERLPAPARRWFAVAVAAVTLGFALLLLALCWIWFDIATFAGLGFDERSFFRETFNSIYRDRTSTIGIGKIWFFLIMPWFAVTLTIHGAANLAEDVAAALGRGEARTREEARI